MASPEEIYLELGNLLQTKPDLSNGIASEEAGRWVAQLTALIEETGDLGDAAELRAASSVNSALSIQSILAVLYRALARAERKAPLAMRGAFIPTGGSYTAFSAVSKAIENTSNVAMFVDPYADHQILETFAVALPEGIEVRVLTDKKSVKPSLKPAVEKWVQQFGGKRPVEVRLAQPQTLHDRLILIDHSRVWGVGQSFKDLANKSSTSLILADPDLAMLKVSAYDQLWSDAEAL